MRRLVYQPFKPTDHGLTCDSVSVESIVERVGTPVYIYSARTIRQAYRAIDEAFASYPHAIHYALKANSTLAIVRLLRALGSRVDANSGGEISVALGAGFDPADIVFTGVGKTRDELEHAVGIGVGVINAESPGELDRIAAIAHAQGRQARVAVRVNPDIDAGSHPNISTGLKINKFGVPLQDARAIYRERQSRAGMRFVGVHVHIGSQITQIKRVKAGVKEAARVYAELVRAGAQVRSSYETQRTRLHAKARLFRRRSGFDTGWMEAMPPSMNPIAMTSGGANHDMAANAENALDQLGAEAIHHRHHDDQRGDAERDADQRQPGDDRDEALALLDAVEHVRERLPTLKRMFASVRGLEEWGVRIVAGEAEAESARTLASGRDYLQVKKRLQEQAAAPSRATIRAANAALKTLARLAAKTRKDAFPPPGRGRPYVTGASFLVSAKRREAWKKHAAKLSKTLAADGHRLEMSGPWPPYHFVSK